MAYKWKPSKTARRAFAEKMQNPVECKAYEARKEAKAEKRRAGSQYDYNTAGGYYLPTALQYQAANELAAIAEGELQSAAAIVVVGYNSGEKVHHDYIHLINEHIRRGK